MRSVQTKQLDQCPICGTREFNGEQQAWDYETLTGEYQVIDCARCDIGFTNPQPLETELSHLYESRTTTDFPHVNPITSALRRANLRRSLGRVLPNTGEAVQALDYGCGDGAFSAAVAEHPRVSHLTAVDFHAEVPPLLRSSPAGKVDYVANAMFLRQDNEFDIAFLRHVLEHSFDPAALLREMHRRLRPGGRLVIDVPNYDGLGRAIFRRHYSALYVPRHLYHFRAKSLCRIVGSYFEIVSVQKTHAPFWGKSIGNALGTSTTNTGTFGIITFPLQLLAEILTGKFSVITMIAKKRQS